MIAEEVINQIDKEIKEIWVNEVAQDYEAGLLLREDSLKCALYHHMRSKLSSILAENNLCIYPEYYFKDLKLLKKGDEIKYKHNEFEKIYEVEKCRIIKDTEWEILKETEENMLTLITCVENQPEYRRCIQAVEKEEEIY